MSSMTWRLTFSTQWSRSTRHCWEQETRMFTAAMQPVSRASKKSRCRWQGFFLCLVLALEKGWTFQPAFNTRWIMSDHTKQVLCNVIRPASPKGGCCVVYSCIAYVFQSISDMFRVSSGKAAKFPNSKGCAPAGSFSSDSLTCWLVELDRNGLERFCAAQHNLQPSEMTSKCMKQEWNTLLSTADSQLL